MGPPLHQYHNAIEVTYEKNPCGPHPAGHGMCAKTGAHPGIGSNPHNKDPGLLDTYVTPDFIIYEAGQKMDLEAFKEFVHASTVLETDWDLSDFRISIDDHSAHASFFNRGTFLVRPDSVQVRTRVEWLESAYLVRDGEALKIKFYFSDRVGMQSDTIP